jgi:hypothetical protein
MIKTFLTLSAAVLLAVPCVQAQSRHDFACGGARPAAAYRHGDDGHHYGGGGRGRYYFFGGVPYFYPFYDIGFGYPGYAYDYGYGYPGFYGDPAYGEAPYEGRIADQSGGPNGPSLPTVVQQQLAKQGYYKGAIDGKFGPESRSALSRFQHRNGLQETGRIDEPTLMALGFSDHR